MTPLPHTQRLRAGFSKMYEGLSEVLAAVRECEELTLDWADQAGEIGEAAYLPEREIEARPESQPTPPAAPAEEAQEETKPEPEAQPEPEPEPESVPAAEPQPTLEDVRGVLAELALAGKKNDIAQILNDHGAAKLSALDPTHYSAVMDAAKKVA